MVNRSDTRPLERLYYTGESGLKKEAKVQQLVFGTQNKTRFAYMEEILKDLPVALESVFHLSSVPEDGDTPEANAVQKALAYYRASGVPTLAIDAGLYVEKFPADRQPGVHVKRFKPGHVAETDAAMLAYYQEMLRVCGGSSPAEWVNAMALVFSETDIRTSVYRRKTFFTAERCAAYTVNEPLNSIQYDLDAGRYVAEMTVSEKASSQAALVAHIQAFVKDAL